MYLYLLVLSTILNIYKVCAGAVQPSSLLAVATRSTLSHRLHLTMISKQTAVV
ncbi:hypothetical protein K458DRAFT_421341 [Lentithecium fluviatile CBS 122367]|uniref:Uncharacterized protein n=1 Tax=Lentithecium fluviatile CBS 122367 TaxID=1168545 RepID=A0A6G1IRR3_9PLEO|nr:hypothetical protein K458DRAFT_421341 [Lentithecium fluviatile CBS 122367]